jgi:2-iminobutanoate/2-iminopropanoate deaminase
MKWIPGSIPFKAVVLLFVAKHYGRSDILISRRIL